MPLVNAMENQADPKQETTLLMVGDMVAHYRMEKSRSDTGVSILGWQTSVAKGHTSRKWRKQRKLLQLFETRTDSTRLANGPPFRTPERFTNQSGLMIWATPTRANTRRTRTRSPCFIPLSDSLSSLFPVLFGKAPELDPARFVWMKFQTKLLQSLPEVFQEAVRVCLILETQDGVICVADDHHLALRPFLAPGVHPKVETVVQIYVCKEW
jgi:hypothetical protein